jgi:hypothetical protein
MLFSSWNVFSSSYSVFRLGMLSGDMLELFCCNLLGTGVYILLAERNKLNLPDDSPPKVDSSE